MIVFLKATPSCVSNVSNKVTIKATFMMLLRFLEDVVIVAMSRNGTLKDFARSTVTLSSWMR